MADARARAAIAATPCSNNTSSEAVEVIDVERARAFELARQKFAVYGREHAHVSHLASARRAHSTTRSPVRIRPSNTATAGAETATHTPATALKNTLLLQENGELALHVDSLNYHLDGVLTHCNSTDERHNSSSSRLPSHAQILVAAQNTVALARLLVQEPVQHVLKLGATGERLGVRLRSVLRLLRPSRSPTAAAALDDRERSTTASVQRFTSEENALHLAVAALAFVLAQSPDPDELFPHDVLDAIAAALQQNVATEAAPATADAVSSESSADTVTSTSRGSSTASASPTAATTAPEGRLQLRKACLKRKTSCSSSSSRDRSSSTSSVEELQLEDDDSATKTASPSRQLGARASAELVTQQIVDLLNSFDAFSIDGRTVEHVATFDVLVLALHSLLQLERRGADCRDHTRRYHSNQRDVATATFASVLARKRRLVENRGLSALIDALSRQFERLETPSNGSTTLGSRDQASVLWRLHVILSVLDQASFLAVPVQRYLVSKPVLMETLLHCIDRLSATCWQPQPSATKRAVSSSSSRQRSTDVLLVVLRVLINLTHHNDAAARLMHAHSGTCVLFRAFCKVWRVVEAASGAAMTIDAQDKTQSSAASSRASVLALEDKALFDAQLLCLSALTNCVEFSSANQLALATLELSADDVVGLDALTTTRPSELLAHYFVRKVQSYVELIDRSESQATEDFSISDASSHSDVSAQWVPEDVVLGGCVSLLLGCLMKDSRANTRAVLAVLPDHSPRLLLRALSAFVALHSQIGALTPEVGDSVLQVEQTLRSLGSEPKADALTVDLEPQSIQDVTDGHETTDCADSDHVRTRQDSACVRTEALLAPQQSAQLPSPAPTAAKRWKNVCSAVDSDSDSGDGGTTAATLANKLAVASSKTTRSPLKRPRTTTRSPSAKSPIKRVRTNSPAPRSPAFNKIRKTNSATSSAATPTRPSATASPLTTSSATRSRQRTTDSSPQPSASSAKSRSKRAHELVNELTHKLSRVCDDRNRQQEPVSAVATHRVDWRQSLGDDDERMDELDFSRDYAPRQPSSTSTSASPRVFVRSRDASPGTPSMRRRRQIVGRLQAQKSPSRAPLATALSAIDSLAAALIPQRSSLEIASCPISTPVRAQSPLSETALKRKRKTSAVRAYAVPAPNSVVLERTSVEDTRSYSAGTERGTSVFDFDA